jgi:hypothetical protein
MSIKKFHLQGSKKMQKDKTIRRLYQKRFKLRSRCGQYFRGLWASELIELLGVSKATAYRIIDSQHLTPIQRELLELKCFGLVPGWDGWRIEPGALVDPQGHRYGIGEILSIPHLKSICSESVKSR